MALSKLSKAMFTCALVLTRSMWNRNLVQSSSSSSYAVSQLAIGLDRTLKVLLPLVTKHQLSQVWKTWVGTFKTTTPSDSLLCTAFLNFRLIFSISMKEKKSRLTRFLFVFWVKIGFPFPWILPFVAPLVCFSTDLPDFLAGPLATT